MTVPQFTTITANGKTVFGLDGSGRVWKYVPAWTGQSISRDAYWVKLTYATNP